MWNEFVKGLPDDFHLVVPDLPGYGQSVKKPSSDGSHRSHSKKEWSQDIIETIQQIPTPRDAVLDIVPTPFMWSRMSLGESRHDETKKSHHWVFLASPAPLPETLISAQADFYYTYTIKSWTGSSALAIIDKTNTIAGWQKDSIAPFLTNDEAAHRRITAACEDRNKQDSVITEPRIPVFSVPVLVLSSTHLRRRFPVDEIWGSLCARDGLTCAQVGDEGTGHFFVNEATEETLGASVPWLSQFK
ncbi:Alpha/beta hydrolase family [Rhizoctonia solani]|uniref:Alpha/beta hydrolase family n=1 Tax=Rhizoctonia solani TaxID=456999 RepID=A0A8H7M8P2_9AGAM|nr:Alpha/beta hydrolase family [Rhizoctonia solani]